MDYKALPVPPSVQIEEISRTNRRSNLDNIPIYITSTGLFITSLLSILLVIADQTCWTGIGSLYHIITTYRASVQIAVQIISNVLGLVLVTVICQLINYATRLHFAKKSVTLNTLKLWVDLCSVRLDWNLPPKFVIALMCFVGMTNIPSALWAGAITPVTTTIAGKALIQTPTYANASLVHEYPSEVGRSGLSIRNQNGLFTYSVGIGLQGALLSSASSATPPVNGSIRQHAKIDNTQFVYQGRSYGVGAAVGLTDDALRSDSTITAYSYQEDGYHSVVTCIYNMSTDFRIDHSDGNWIYAVTGDLPNSDSPEYSDYFGHDTSSIVAIGVAGARNRERILGIAAGTNYANLNATQCSVDFVPTRFNVSVNLIGRNITVTPIGKSSDIEPSGNLTLTLMRQFALISADETNIYTSLVGNSFNASIDDYTTSQASLKPSVQQASLAGLTNSVTVMIDDILVAYASAQLVIANVTSEITIVSTITGIKFGERIYIYAVSAVNLLILLLFLWEVFRTGGWATLTSFDYMETSQLILSSSIGGSMGGTILENSTGYSTTKPIKADEIGNTPVCLLDCEDGTVIVPSHYFRSTDVYSSKA